MSTTLTLGTTITRIDADGDPVVCDVAVHFTAACTSPGYPATWTQPGEGPDYELTFERAEFDGGEPDDAPGPLNYAELATLKVWFVANFDRAYEAANDNHDDGRDPDDRGWRGLEA